ncbi:hypothetical protein AB1L05_09195 [Cytobacillus horneckiae]
MYRILTDKSINWEAISAISNILVVFATFVTILVTIWLTYRNSTPRGRVMHTSTNDKENLHLCKYWSNRFNYIGWSNFHEQNN